MFVYTSVFQLQLGLAVAAIGAIYIAIGVPYIISSIIVGRLTDKLVRLASVHYFNRVCQCVCVCNGSGMFMGWE